MPVMAKQTFVLGNFRMGLVHHLAMFFVTSVARLGLGGRQQGRVRIQMKGWMTIAAFALGVGSVNMGQLFWGGQRVVAGQTGVALDGGFSSRLMRIMTNAALDRGVGRVLHKANERIDLIGVT